MSNDSNDDANPGRRNFLTGTTCALFAAGGAGILTPYVKSWNPSARAKAAGAPITIDISKMAEGEMLVKEWRGLPIYVIKRTKEMVESYKGLEGDLRDPESDKDQQPDYAKNANVDNRSEKDIIDEYFAVRKATVALFNGLEDDAWERRGIASGSPVTPLSLAFIIAGHELHHIEVIRKKYLLV